MALFLNGKQVRGSLIVEGDLTMPLPTVDTASGSVATFDTDLTENLIEVKCQIVAQQSGSGTPSPSNPRPITTYSEMNFTHSGKNFYNINNQTVTSINTYCSMYLPSNSDVTFSTNIPQTGLYAQYYDNGNWVEIARMYNSRSLTFNTGNHNYIRLSTYNEGVQATEFQAEFGTIATAYEPFDGTTANIPFGKTVVNGVLNVTTGKLTDEVLKIDKNDFSSMNVSFNSEIGIIRSFYLSLPLNTRKVDSFVLSNKFASQPLSGSHAYDCEVATSGGAYTVQRIYFSISNVDYPAITAEQAKQFLIDNDVEFYVTRYSNIETQLDSITLQSLLNENNVWCDTGDTEVKFILSVGKKIA